MNTCPENNAVTIKEAFTVPNRRGYSFNQRFESLVRASIPPIGALELEDVKASEADTKPRIFMENVSN